MTIFKYHIALYDLYQVFGNLPFCAGEMNKLEIIGLNQSSLSWKGYLHEIGRGDAEKLRPEIKSWIKANWVFRQLTPKGIKLVEYLKEHPEVIAKKLLSGKARIDL